jgi:NAD(P)-dependent dehydrogenase (short-subunit alcohol dehydrogenase family)
MCEYPHVVVTGASSGAGRAVTLLRRAQGRIVLIEPADARLTPPFAGPLTAMSATLRAELAPWHIDVTLTEPGGGGRSHHLCPDRTPATSDVA